MIARKVGIAGLLLALIVVFYVLLKQGASSIRPGEQAFAEIKKSAPTADAGTRDPGRIGDRRPPTADQLRQTAPMPIREQFLSSNDWKDMLGKLDGMTSVPVGERLFYKAIILDSCSNYQELVDKGGADTIALTKAGGFSELISYITKFMSDGRQRAAMAYNLERRVVNVCRGFANTPVSQEAVEKAFADAAAAGDLRAQARMIEKRLAESAARNAASLSREYQQYAPPDRPVGFPDPITVAERDQLVNGLFSGDPIAIRTAGNVLSLGSDRQSLRFGPDQIDIGVHSDITWDLVACQFGFECGARNLQVNYACAELRRCSDDYASYIRDFVLTPSEFAPVQANAIAIADAIRRGDQSAFLLVAQPGFRRTLGVLPSRITIH